MQHPHTPAPLVTTEVVSETLTVSELASCGAVTVEWITAHVQAGVLLPQTGEERGAWRFASTCLRRVRRIAQMERIFDADPQLAALTADLMEEVARLRRALEAR